MSITSASLIKDWEHTHCELNAISFDELLKYYYDTKFIYDEKKELLEGHLQEIKSNWEKMTHCGDSLIKTVTYRQGIKFATVSFYRNSTGGWIGQHLASNGLGISYLPLIGSLGQFIHDDAHASNPKYVQCWYNPEKRLPKMFFQTTLLPLDPAQVSDTEWGYFKAPFPKEAAHEEEVGVELMTPHNASLIRKIIIQHCDDILIEAEALFGGEAEDNRMAQLYSQAGLKKARKFYLASSVKTGSLLGIFIANIAPLGLNLSFLENRCLFLPVPNLLGSNLMPKTIKAGLETVAADYKDFSPAYIPLMVPTAYTPKVLGMGLELFRTYNQSIWRRDVFIEWYQEIENVFKKYGSRFKE